MLDRIQEMSEAIELARPEVRPSKYWEELNRTNLRQLSEEGYGNFKRTIAKNYFTFMRLWPWDPQILYLARNLPLSVTLRCAMNTFRPLKHECIPLFESWALNFLTNLLWEYATRTRSATLGKLSEPRIGNPPKIERNGELISQDLANSVLEFDSMMEGIKHPEKLKTIFELGAGYGRNAFVFLKLMPRIRYVVVDIPPALAVSERYLSEVFPEKKVFKFRRFKDYSEVREEFESAEIAFLLSDQLELIPDAAVDLFINISSLQEMRMEQIRYYLAQIKRLTAAGQYFYLKQWKRSRIPFENVEILEKDYPLDDWDVIFRREAKVQSSFFEALLRNYVV